MGEDSAGARVKLDRTDGSVVALGAVGALAVAGVLRRRGSAASPPWVTVDDVEGGLRAARNLSDLERRLDEAEAWWSRAYPYPIAPERDEVWRRITDAFDERAGWLTERSGSGARATMEG